MCEFLLEQYHVTSCAVDLDLFLDALKHVSERFHWGENGTSNQSELSLIVKSMFDEHARSMYVGARIEVGFDRIGQSDVRQTTAL